MEFYFLSFAKVNGVNLYYELKGDQGDPMVLIHGSWGDHLNWASVIDGLSQNFKVISYDRRGHGQSEKVISQGSFDEDAQDAEELIKQLEVAPVHIVGNSGGASIALKLAARNPSIFRSLIVHEPPLFDLLKDDPSTAQIPIEIRRRTEIVAKKLQSGDKVEGARLFVETMAFGPGMWDKFAPQLRETFVANADTFLDETKDIAGYTVDLDGLSQFTKPALLTYGGKGIVGGKFIIEKLAKAISGSKIEVYSDDGHTPHISNPKEFIQRTVSFAMASS